MTTTNGGPAPESAPQLNVLAQYVKDFSFENPNAPRSLSTPQQAPEISVKINVAVGQMAPTDYEVTLTLDGEAKGTVGILFKIELSFAGIFRIQNFPQEHLQPLVRIECPRLLFPFAREIVATAVRNGGFPPLLLDPVDFAGLYRQHIGELPPQAPPQPPPPATA